MAEVILKYKPNINQKDFFERTPLQIAVRLGNVRMIKLLLAHHAVPSVKSQNGLSCIDLC